MKPKISTCCCVAAAGALDQWTLSPRPAPLSGSATSIHARATYCFKGDISEQLSNECRAWMQLVQWRRALWAGGIYLSANDRRQWLFPSVLFRNVGGKNRHFTDKPAERGFFALNN